MLRIGITGNIGAGFIVEPIKLSKEEIKKIYLAGQIKFIDRYNLKFENYA